MSLIPSQYPPDAVEYSVTFLVPVTDENRKEVDGAVRDLLDGSDITWWPTSLAHFVADHGQVVRYDFARPPEFVRPRAKKKRL